MTEPTQEAPITLVTPELQMLAKSVENACAMRAEDGYFTVSAVTTVYGLMYGHLRGNVPEVLPRDLRAVVVGAGTRYNLMLSKSRGVRPIGDAEPLQGLPDFLGFTLPELVVLARYRKRTA